MLLLVGLGNPGREHEQDRHNIGFMAVDEIIRRHDFSAPRSRFQGLLAEGIVSGEKILALKPMTFMNESGRAVAQAQHFYKLDADRIVVFHDELDLVAGKVKVKRGGGAAGQTGTGRNDSNVDKDYWRCRVGIGRPGDNGRVHGHVLGKFNKDDARWRDPLIDAIATALPDLVTDGASAFMNRVAIALRPPAQRPEKPQPAPDNGNNHVDVQGDDQQPGKTTLGAALSAAFSRLRNSKQK